MSAKRAWLYAWIILGLLLVNMIPAYAGDYHIYPGTPGISGATPFDICAPRCAQDTNCNSDQPPPSTGHWYPVCFVRGVSFTGGWGVCYRSLTPGSSAGCSGEADVRVLSGGGNTCFEAARGSVTGSAYYASVGACTPCDPPEEWNDTTHACEMPDCDSGEIFDDEIDGCRPECESTEYYQYSSSSCVVKCPSGGYASPYVWITNKPFVAAVGDTINVNGCKIEVVFACEPEIEPHHYEGASFTGKVCGTIFHYAEPEVQVTMVTQAEAEEACGCTLAFGGDDHTPVLDGLATDATLVMEASQIGSNTEPVDIVLMHTLCLGGVRRMVITVNGAPDEVEFLGACPNPNEDIEVAGGGTSGGVQQTQIADNVTAIKEAQAEDHTILDALNAGIDEIKTALAMDAPEGGGPAGEFVAPEIPEVTSEHNGGIAGELGTGDLGDTALAAFLNHLVPTLSSPEEACPSYSFPEIRPFISAFVFTPDCQIWDVMGAMALLFFGFISWTIVWRV